MSRIFLIALAISIPSISALPVASYADIDPPAITGLIFVDKNGNNTRDENEVGVANTSVTIYVDNIEPASSPESCASSANFGNSTFDQGEVFEISSDSGFYELAPVLEPANAYPYCVTVRREINHTYQNIITSTLDIYYNILIDDENDLEEGYDFAATSNGAFSGYAWRDENADGTKDDSEQILENLEVVATPIDALNGATSTSANRAFATSTSNNAGAYQFDFTPQQFGYWRFHFIPIPGLALTSQPTVFETYIGSGDDIYAQNFGFGETAIITDDPFIASGGTADSTTSAKPLNSLQDTVILIDDKLGSSTIIISPQTIISEQDITPFDLNQFQSHFVSATSLSGLPSGSFVAGIQFGIDTLKLLFSLPVHILIGVDQEHEGEYLYIFHANTSAGPWDTIGLSTTTCLVMNSTCSFSTTVGGYFALIATSSPTLPKETETAPTVPTSSPISEPPIQSNGAPVGLMGSGGGSGGGSIIPTYGQVLGVSTSSTTTAPLSGPTSPSPSGNTPSTPTATPPVCTPYLTHRIARNAPNDAQEVLKLQQFLNQHYSLSIPLTGYYGAITYQAVLTLQRDNAATILHPLGITEPTGYVGNMTIAWINNEICARDE